MQNNDELKTDFVYYSDRHPTIPVEGLREAFHGGVVGTEDGVDRNIRAGSLVLQGNPRAGGRGVQHAHDTGIQPIMRLRWIMYQLGPTSQNTNILCFGNCFMVFGNCIMVFGNCIVVFGNCIMVFGNCILVFGNCIVSIWELYV